MLFRVGQRVKRISDPLDMWADVTSMPIGATGVVLRIEHGFIFVKPDSGGIAWGCDPDTLAPLTDPSADQFLENMRKLAQEPLILSPEETLQIAGGA